VDVDKEVAVDQVENVVVNLLITLYLLRITQSYKVTIKMLILVWDVECQQNLHLLSKETLLLIWDLVMEMIALLQEL